VIRPAEVVVNGESPLSADRVAAAVRLVLGLEQREAAMSVTFLDPSAMAVMNRDYKGHDRPTDVISFSLPQPDGSLAGDIYICPSEAAREAGERQEAVERELLRVVVHGTLHVLGHDHPEDEGREQSRMWALQERYLAELP
jgi:probable rRNA maturation factor